MADDQIARLFGDLGAPVEPDRDFREELFESLVADIDFGRGRPRSLTAAGVTRVWRSGMSWRVAWLVALMALLLAALLGLAVGQHRTVAEDLISRSQDAMRHSSPFDVSVAYSGGSIGYQYDGRLLRGEIQAGGRTGRNPGQSFIFDGRTYFEFEADGSFIGAFNALGANGIRYSRAVGPGAPTHPLGRTWALGAYLLSWPAYGDAEPPTLASCPGATLLGDEAIANRRAFHVRCRTPLLRGDYWIDQKTLLLLKASPAYDSPAVAVAIVDTPNIAPLAGRLPVVAGRGEILRIGALEPGRYATSEFQVPIVVDVLDGWFNGIDQPNWGTLQGPSEVGIGWNLPTQYIDRQTGATEPLPSTDAGGMIDWLSAREPGVIGVVTQVTFDGLAAYEFDVRPDALLGCPAGLPSCAATLPPGPWVGRGLAVDVQGRVVTFWSIAHDRAGLEEAGRQLERIHFG